MYTVQCVGCDADVIRSKRLKTARCRDCKRLYRRQHYQDNKEIYLARARRTQANLKKRILDSYGTECACCGEDEPTFLELDHINGGGTAHRKEIGGGSHYWAWIIRNNFPEEYQILCSNCNTGKHRNGGICPHNN